jgi:type IV pilus assembly protein PilW
MQPKFILWKLFIQNSSKGLTLIELIVSLLIGAILLSLTLSLLVSNRKLYVEDIARTEVNQNLRATLDIIGTDLKQAGERITEENFPVLEIKNSSDLTIRLNLALPILRTCENINSGSSTNSIPIVCANTIADLQEWQAYRCSLDGVAGCQGNNQERVRAFIHDGNGNGEYFTYSSENTTNLSINRFNDGSLWLNNYSNNSTLYVLEEHRYQLVNNILKLTIDGNKNLNVVNGIQSFEVKASLPSLTIETGTFPYTHTDGNVYRWWKLQSVKVNIQAKDPSPGAYQISQTKLNITGQFFPRNSLSR